MTYEQILNTVIREMAVRSVNGVFFGSPRRIMEEVAYSSGSLYRGLTTRGIKRIKSGPNGRWLIPRRILQLYGVQ